MEDMKSVQFLLHCANSPERKFVYSQDAEETDSKKVNYLAPAQKFKAHSQGDFGTISDAYILYMIGLMEYVDEETIIRLVQAYAKSNRHLAIAAQKGVTAEAGIAYRLHALCSQYAMCFHRSYKVERNNTMETITLWGCDPSSTTFVASKMSKKIAGRDGTIYANVNTMIGKAAAAFVAGQVADKSGCGFKSILESAFKSTELGKRLLPPIFFMSDEVHDREYEIMFYPAFLNFVKSYQTDSDYKLFLKEKCAEIKNFLYQVNRSKSKQEGYVVVVCESQTDMEIFKNLCEQVSITVDCGNIDHIYLTSEGAIRVVPRIKDAFLRMVKNAEGAIMFRKEIPPFIISD